MATSRKETLERKNALLHDLRAEYLRGASEAGERAVSLRELSAKYGLAMRTVSIELQKLIDEGVLYSVPRVGTFVGRPHAARANLFLALFRYIEASNDHWGAIRDGFEDRIAQLGGTSLILDFETAARYRAAGTLVNPAGVFEFHDFEAPPVWKEPGLPHAEFGELHTVHAGSDAVYFDNVDGGYRATRHLLALGHRRIAFMGIHGDDGEPGPFLWSQEREAGWRRALGEADIDADGLAYRPRQTPPLDIPTMQSQSVEVAERLLGHHDAGGAGEITAIVVVNAIAAGGLFEAFRKEGRSVEGWPAIVGFDSELAHPTGDPLHAVTAFRLPWQDIGREAANLLWERANGKLQGPQQRLVPMNLIPRLSCRREWHRAPSLEPARFSPRKAKVRA